MNRFSLLLSLSLLCLLMLAPPASAVETGSDAKPAQTTKGADAKTDAEAKTVVDGDAAGTAEAAAEAAAGLAATVTPKPAAKEAEKPAVEAKPVGPQQFYQAEADGWSSVSHWLAAAQTFTATGSIVKSMGLRVAALNENLPPYPLRVEIRDTKLKTIYLLGFIQPNVLRRDFYWQPVKLDYVGPMKPGERYVMVFTSTLSKGNHVWLVNTVYNDVYPYGRHSAHATQDIFFSLSFDNGSLIYVGPRSNNTTKKTPINSGIAGGVNEHVENGVDVPGFGDLPFGNFATGKKAGAKAGSKKKSAK